MGTKKASGFGSYFLGIVLVGSVTGLQLANATPDQIEKSPGRTESPRLLESSRFASPGLLNDIEKLSRAAPSRAPASAGAPGVASFFSSPLSTTLSLGEPAWYRDPASLSLGAPTPTPRPNDLLGSDRAPSHPVDGMWRHYDSRGLSR